MKPAQLVVVALLVLVVVGVVIALVVLNQPPAATTVTEVAQQQNNDVPQNTAEPTITPIPAVQIVIAIQDIPRGTRIDNNTVALVDWPADRLPVNAVTTLESVLGGIARTDIYREEPILGNLVVPDFQSLASIGSDAALITPPNRVLVSIPMNRLTSVAYAIQPGDRIDIIASLLFVDVDPTFQSAEPNGFNLVTVSQPTETTTTAGTASVATIDIGGTTIRGAFDSRLIGGQVFSVLVSPSEQARPRLSVQRTVQDALVVWVGNFPDDGKLFAPAPTPTPELPTATPEGTTGETAPAPTPVVITRDIVSVAVAPQDAVVLTWFVEAKIPFTFALRSAATTTLPDTDPVTLDYIMTRFNILVPDTFNYALEPAIRSIRSLEVGDQISLQSTGG